MKNEEIQIQVFDSHEASDRYEARQRSRMSKAERMQRFSELQRRFWGEAYSDNRDTSLKEDGFSGVRQMHD